MYIRYLMHLLESIIEDLNIYVRDVRAPCLAEFLENPHYKRSLLDFVYGYKNARDAQVAFARMCKNFTRKIVLKGVNWKLLLAQAKARQRILERSTRVVAAGTNEAAQQLESLFETSTSKSSQNRTSEAADVKHEE
ncbi:hypothetical protein BJV82DRAFT_610328 [Fennellomyces sp. T-0311]|nr:hypothetical protein BJV82DRAFT_610328 [Fennellomyces sp. T-0311]